MAVTDVGAVGGVVGVELDGEAVGEESVDTVGLPDEFPRVPVTDGLTVPQQDVVTVEDNDALVTGDVLHENDDHIVLFARSDLTAPLTGVADHLPAPPRLTGEHSLTEITLQTGS